MGDNFGMLRKNGQMMRFFLNQGLALFTNIVAIGHIIGEYKAFWEIAVGFKKPIKTDKIIKTTKTMKFMKKILRELHGIIKKTTWNKLPCDSAVNHLQGFNYSTPDSSGRPREDKWFHKGLLPGPVSGDKIFQGCRLAMEREMGCPHSYRSPSQHPQQFLLQWTTALLPSRGEHQIAGELSRHTNRIQKIRHRSYNALCRHQCKRCFNPTYEDAGLSSLALSIL